MSGSGQAPQNHPAHLAESTDQAVARIMAAVHDLTVESEALRAKHSQLRGGIRALTSGQAAIHARDAHLFAELTPMERFDQLQITMTRLVALATSLKKDDGRDRAAAVAMMRTYDEVADELMALWGAMVLGGDCALIDALLRDIG
ncbi:MAG: hypothetical protein AAF618_00305 [Pseudomonadota bacterium]